MKAANPQQRGDPRRCRDLRRRRVSNRMTAYRTIDSVCQQCFVLRTAMRERDPQMLRRLLARLAVTILQKEAGRISRMPTPQP